MMLLSRSLGRKIVATGTAAVAFAFLYESTILDSRYAARQAEFRESTARPAPGARLRFTATAYCRGTTTASGVNVRNGIAAADPDLLPVGSVVQVDRLGDRYNGIYTVMDTGPAVQGRHIDIYMWSCDEARYEFGKRYGRVDRAPPRVESACQHAEPRRSPVQTPGSCAEPVEAAPLGLPPSRTRRSRNRSRRSREAFSGTPVADVLSSGSVVSLS